MPWTHAASLRNYHVLARSLGLDPDEVLRRCDIDPGALDDLENRISLSAAVKLLEDSAVESGCPHFGLMLAEMRTESQIIPLSLFVRNQKDLRDTIDAFATYQHAMSDSLSINIEPLDTGAIVRTQLITQVRFPPRQAIEYFMAICAGLFSSLGGDRWSPECVHFMHRAPDDRSIYQRIFRGPLQFESNFNGFVFSDAALSAPNIGAQPHMADYARTYLETLYPPPIDAMASDGMRRALYLLLPKGVSRMEDVAARLGVHERALQRMLEREGLSYSSVLNDVRCELVLRHLANPAHSISAIASLLGYASLSSFTRWFATQFGISPSAWRTAEQAMKPKHRWDHPDALHL